MIRFTIYEKNIENVGDIRGFLRSFANGHNKMCFLKLKI